MYFLTNKIITDYKGEWTGGGNNLMLSKIEKKRSNFNDKKLDLMNILFN